MTQYSQSIVSVGLTASTFVAPVAGQYYLRGSLSIPQLATGASAPSAVVVTIVNATGPVTLYTGTAGAMGFQINAICAAGDSISVTLSSAAAVDQPLNAIKAVMIFGLGILE